MGLPMGLPWYGGQIETGMSEGTSMRETRASGRKRRVPEGVEVRHAPSCPSREPGKRCTCQPSYRATVPYGARGERQRKTFATQDAANAWRTDQLAARSRTRRRAPSKATLREAAEVFLAGMREGTIATRSGETYKPSVIRSYEQTLNSHVLPDLGARAVGDLEAADLQTLTERLRRKGLSPSTIQNSINPLQAIYRRLMMLGDVTANPCRDIVLPTIRGRRMHAGDPADALRLIETSPEQDRCIWALAFFAGLRLGELRALEWGGIDDRTNVIRVTRSWDDREGPIPVKSAAGEREIPIISQLRPHLQNQRHRCSWQPDGLVLGRGATTPFHYNGLYYRSKKAWSEAGIARVTPHQARHSFASFLIAAGTDVKALTEIMGHTSVRQSFDRYGHLLSNSHATTASRLGAFLDSAAG